MNNLLKAREVTWFLVGLTCMMLAFYTYYNDQKGQSLYFAVISFVSVLMFYLRRKQRRELEKENKTEQE